MIAAFVLHFNKDSILYQPEWFEGTSLKSVACGTSSVQADLSEAKDFSPNYATLNSALFESSVIMTIHSHLDSLTQAPYIAILHSDITTTREPRSMWTELLGMALKGSAVGLTMPSEYKGSFNQSLTVNTQFFPRNDPQFHEPFDGIWIWDKIRQVDSDLHEWAITTQPPLIYTHQFLCTRQLFQKLGAALKRALTKIRLDEVGLWTPHVFERLVALYLAKFGGSPTITSAFLHNHKLSSVLYGVRPVQYMK